MELASLLIAAGFVLYAWVFLLRLRRSDAAVGKLVTRESQGQLVAAPLGYPRLKFLLFLVLALVVLAALVVSAGMLVRPACTTGVVIIEGPHGEKIECVCVGGVQAVCFEPGP